MLGQYMHSSVGFGSYGNGFSSYRNSLGTFGDLDLEITIAEQEVKDAGAAVPLAIHAATVPDGSCMAGYAPLPPMACNSALAMQMEAAQIRLARAGKKLGDLHDRKAGEAATETLRLLATKKATAARAAALKTEQAAAQTKQAAQQAQQAKASGDPAAAKKATQAAKQAGKSATSAAEETTGAWSTQQKLLLVGAIGGTVVAGYFLFGRK